MSALKKFRTERSATHVRDGILAVRMAEPETSPHPLPNTFTPLEQQVVDLRNSLPNNMILVIMCGYKMKCIGRDARVVARRLGFQCMFPSNSAFEYCSFPVQRTILHCSRLVTMGYHVGIVDQVESAAARATSGTSNAKVFERKLTRALSRASAPDFSSLSIGGGSTSGGAGEDDGDDGEGDGAGDLDNGNEGAPTTSTEGETRSAAVASDESNFILFISETESRTELTFVSIGSRTMTHKTISIRPDNGRKKPSGEEEAAPHVTDTAEAAHTNVYHEEVISALQSGLLCYAPVEIVVKSSVATERPSENTTANDDARKLSRTLSSVINALCTYHMGPSSDDADGATAAGGGNGGGLLANKGSTLVTIMDDKLERAYLASSPSVTKSHLPDHIQHDPEEAGSLEEEVDDRPVATRSMMKAYFAFFQATEALRAVAMAPFLYRKEDTMHIPPTSLQALDVFPSARTAASGDSLFSFVNRSMTSYGARRLRAWLAAPMCNLERIKERQAAIRELAEDIVNKKLLRAFLKEGQGADIETTMTRLCSGRCSYAEYRTFLDKIAALRGKAEALVMDYTSALEEKQVGVEASSVIEKTLTDFISDQVEAALKEEALYTKYDKERSLEEVLMSGLRPLPATLKREEDAIREAEKALEEELEEARQVLKLPNLQYKTVALVTNLIEVPTASEGRVPKHWSVVSRIKTATRYRTEEIVHQCALRTAAEERLSEAAHTYFVEHQLERYGKASSSSMTRKKVREIATTRNAEQEESDLASVAPSVGTSSIDTSITSGSAVVDLYSAFSKFIGAVATIDALHSLAVLANTPGFSLPTLIPQTIKSVTEGSYMGVVSATNGSISSSSSFSGSLLLRGLAHPMTRARHPSYVACDVVFDGPKRAWLLTGPNMGGKSALMRSVALCAVLGQCGAHVPATEAVLPIFTSLWCRMGAQDDLLEGSSTFMLEMRETRDIVSSPDLPTSLVLMDELGRGTSSYDGVAVADATLTHILRSRCVCLFVTHYHLLTDWHRYDESLALKYMSFVEMAKEEEDDNTSVDADDSKKRRRRILFLYQPVDGVTPSSFGINVAAMAGLPEEVLSMADERSRLAEKRHSATRALHVLRSLLRSQ